MPIGLTTPDPARDAVAAFEAPPAALSARERQLAYLVSTWLAASAHRVAPA